jgi:hypothetical protein
MTLALVEAPRKLNGAGRHTLDGETLHSELSRERLQWYPEIGVGYYPVEAGNEPYNRHYFERFREQSKTEIGQRLMRARCAMVARHYQSELLDVGIGSGAFIEERSHWCGDTFGWDINPAGIEWLKQRGCYRDPFGPLPVWAMSMWDVLEHIEDFRPLLAKIRYYLFVSLPIFRDGKHASTSKHFRPDEHFWYFTRDGFVNVIQSLGFRLLEENNIETQLGRSDIRSFAFLRT